jgi:hypothetical protein
MHELIYCGAHVKCKAYQRRWLKLSIAFKVGENFISGLLSVSRYQPNQIRDRN